MNKTIGILALAAVMGPNAMAQFTETEANNNKAQANVFAPAGPGFTITGNSTGTSTTVAGAASADYFRLNMFTGSLGIYRHQVVITSNVAGHTGTIRGLNQTSSTAGGVIGTLDNTFATSSTATTPARMNQWYGFGKGESLYYRVTGAAATTADYTVTHSMTQVSALNAGTYNFGNIVINTVGTTGSTQIDTDLWIYDSNFNAIAGYGNDDEPAPGTTLGSKLTRSYAPGVYYLAISDFAIANNLASPGDDRFQTGTVMDFPNILANSSTTLRPTLGFTINGVLFQTPKLNAYDVQFAQFTVVPEPGTMIAIGAGIGALAMRRRRRNK
jgi:hypothetical protein